MDVVVCTSARFYEDEPHVVRAFNPVYGYEFWCRYLDVYDSVTVVARVAAHGGRSKGAVVAGRGVSVLPVADFRGLMGTAKYRLWGMMRTKAAVLAQLEDAALHVRVPCSIGSAVVSALPDGFPYVAEVIGDPLMVFSASRGRFSRVAAMAAARQMRQTVLGARHAIYVTGSYLQDRYPARSASCSAWVTSARIPSEAFAANTRRDSVADPKSVHRLVFVGSLEGEHKGLGYLLRAVEILRDAGVRVTLDVVGDGRLRQEYEGRCRVRGIQDVHFHGSFSSQAAVLDMVRGAALFVLPSLAEGMPRAVLEAMAVGRACIATDVGGTSDLLQADALVPPGDAHALASRIEQFLGNEALLRAQAARNLDRAREFEASRAQERFAGVCRSARFARARWSREHG